MGSHEQPPSSPTSIALAMEAPSTACVALGISEDVFHGIHLQLRGISVFNDTDELENVPVTELHLRLPGNRQGCQSSVPKKIPVLPRGETPYEYHGDQVLFNGMPVFSSQPVIEVALPEKDTPRYFKGYSFPFLGTESPYYELRINPRNTGKCPGGCLFCHRKRSFADIHVPRLLPPEDILALIRREHGADVFRDVFQVSVITELFGSEPKYLSYLERLKALLVAAGCPTSVRYSACSQDVRSRSGLQRLRNTNRGTLLIHA